MEKYLKALMADIRKTWKCIKEVLFNGKPPKNDIQVFSTNNSVNEKLEKINEMNVHFANVGKKIIDEVEHVPFYSRPNPQYPGFELKHTSAIEVEKVVEKTKSSKTQGYDEIDSIVFKQNSKILAPIIARIINDSIDCSRVDNSLKISRMKPVFEEGDRKDLGNYRPISILPNVDKIMSKIINNQSLHIT